MVQQALFILIAVLTLAAAAGAVTARNLFHAALFLVAAFAGVAVIYVLLEAEFLAVAQVIIYIGAISTLIVFAIMLSRSMMGKDAGELNRYALAMVAFVIIGFGLLAYLLTSINFNVVNVAVPADAIAQIGEGFVNQYVIPFEVASVMLLVALIGAIMLARERQV